MNRQMDEWMEGRMNKALVYNVMVILGHLSLYKHPHSHRQKNLSKILVFSLFSPQAGHGISWPSDRPC